MKKLFQGGQVFGGEGLICADVLVQDSTISAVGSGLICEDAEVINAAGMLISPGFIDLHAHLRQPGFEAKETIATGTAAAAAGGYTTVCSMPNLSPVPDSLQNLAPQLDAIAADALVRVLPYAALTIGENGVSTSDIEGLKDAVAGFSDDGRGVQSEAVMASSMARVAAAGSMVAAHCEVDALLPKNNVCVQQNSTFALKHGFSGHSNESESAEVERDIRLARKTGCRLHICHTSAARSFALVREAKAQNLPISCEVTPHNLLLNCENVNKNDGRFKMNPPLRTAEDVSAAVSALLDGTIDAIATDHAPHTQQEKAGGFATAANGVVGLETAFAALYTHLVLTGLVPLKVLLGALTAGPARVLGEDAPRIAPGQPANLTMLDLNTPHSVTPAHFKSKGRSTPFEGWSLKGWPVLTLYRGRTVYKRGDNA